MEKHDKLSAGPHSMDLPIIIMENDHILYDAILPFMRAH